MKNIGEKAYASTLNTAIGDSLGLPIEKYTHQQIKETFGEVTQLLCIRYNTFHKEAIQQGSIEGDEIGMVSDDTLLTLAIIQAIIEKGEFNLQKITDYQAKIAGDRPWSFGKGTLAAFEKIRNGAQLQESGGTTPGNGVMMKQAPLAAYAVAQSLDARSSQEMIDQVCKVTHNSPLVRMAAIAHHEFLTKLYNNSHKSIKFEISGLMIRLAQLETELGYCHTDGPTIRVFMEQLDSRIASNGNWIGPNGLQEIFDRCTVYWTVTDKVDGKKKEVPNPFHIISTYAICYTLFAKGICEGNLEKMLLDAINIGGDTDSYGAIIGAMIGAYDGTLLRPELISQLIDNKQIMTTAKEYQKFLENIERNKMLLAI